MDRPLAPLVPPRVLAALAALALLAAALPRASAQPAQPQADQALLALWKADYERTLNAYSRDDGVGRYTHRLEWVTPPSIQDGNVVGRHQIWQTNAFYAGEHKGKTVRQTVNSFYVGNPQPGVYLSVAELRRKYATAAAPAAPASFEAAVAEAMKALQGVIENLVEMRAGAVKRYRDSYASSPEGKRPVVRGEEYTGEEVSLTSTRNVPLALENEEKRRQENALLREIAKLDQLIAEKTALRRVAAQAQAELQRLAALGPQEIERLRQEQQRQAEAYGLEYGRGEEKVRKANREHTQAMLEASHGVLGGGLAAPKSAMSNPDATSAVDRMRRAGDRYEAALQEREGFLKLHKECQFKAEFYRLAGEVAARLQAGR